MTTLESAITVTIPMSRYALWSYRRHAQSAENPGGHLAENPGGYLAEKPGFLLAPPHRHTHTATTGRISPFSPTLTNNDPLHVGEGGPGQLVKTGPARLRFHYAIITGNPDDSP